MALDIVTYPDSVLRAEAAPVADVADEIRTLAAGMAEAMYAAKGRGLAAPQVGRSLRLFVMDCDWKDGADRAVRTFINPEIVELIGPKLTGAEACLSIPGVTGSVPRAAEVVLAWTNLEGERREGRFDGFEAVCIQHEYDHLDGILWFDRIDAEERARLSDDLRAIGALE
ncbi:MAG: peptide deformylase [Pseudomonadota bacterium]